MKTKEINPVDGIYAATRDYVHAMEVSGASRQLFVSGTMGLAEDGAAPASLDEQLDLIWKNIRLILAKPASSLLLCAETSDCWIATSWRLTAAGSKR